MESQQWKETSYCLPPPTAKKKYSTTKTQTTDAGSAKPTKDTPHHKPIWRRSAGNRVATIQEEMSAICKRVPFQSHPADVTLLGIETSTPPTSTTWRKKSPYESFGWPTTEVTTTTDNLEGKCVRCSSKYPVDITEYNGYWRTHRSLYTADPLAIAALTKPTGNRSTLTGVPTFEVPPINST
jgi:hypothetical protein